jgi:hypothetical protein
VKLSEHTKICSDFLARYGDAEVVLAQWRCERGRPTGTPMLVMSTYEDTLPKYQIFPELEYE